MEGLRQHPVKTCKTGLKKLPLRVAKLRRQWGIFYCYCNILQLATECSTFVNAVYLYLASSKELFLLLCIGTL